MCKLSEDKKLQILAEYFFNFGVVSVASLSRCDVSVACAGAVKSAVQSQERGEV